MIQMALESLWHFIWGWATIDLIVGATAVVIAVLEPPIVAIIIPDLRKWAIMVAIVAFTCMGILAHGYQNGLAEKQRQWDEALQSEVASGGKILDDARRDARTDTPDSLRNDSWNRDSRAKPDVR